MPRLRGVYTLDDIYARCSIDDASGCWVWRYACLGNGIPHTHVPAGVIGPRRVSLSARRVSLILSGVEIRPGMSVYSRCGNSMCVNPAHLRQARMSTVLKAAGKASGGALFRDPRRLAALAQYRESWTVPADVVAAVQADIEAGSTAKAAAKRHGISYWIAKRIYRGEHVHQRPKEFAGASVFSWRPQSA